MAVISNLSVSLTANTKGMQRGLKKAQRQLKTFTGKVLNVKTAIGSALGIGGVGAVINSSLAAYKQQEQAVVALGKTNEIVGRTTKGLTSGMIQQAKLMQKEGIIPDEVILQGMRILSTYSTIPDELLPRASRAMVDMMAQFGLSGQSAANLLGKASMGMASNLREVGLTLSENTTRAVNQQKAIQQMAAKAGVNIDSLSGNSRVFSMLLGDIESQVGGINKAVGSSATGAFDKLAISLNQFRETIGEIVASGLGKWVRQLSIDLDSTKFNIDELATSFRNWVTDVMIGMSPVVNAFKGFKLVIKTVQLAFYGFASLVSGTLKNLFGVVSSFGNAFGIDVGSNVFKHFEINKKIHEENLQKVRDLKAEMKSLATEINTNSFGEKFANQLKEFDQRATITERNLNQPSKPVTTPTLEGKIDKLIITPGSTEIRMMNIPQIDKTNELLGRILTNKAFAVAG